MVVLPDTNVLILSLAGKAPDASVFEKLITQNKLAFSPITIAEFLAALLTNDTKDFPMKDIKVIRP